MEKKINFSYEELRDKHPSLSKVSKREYVNNKQLQDELEGVRIDGSTWMDDYDFDEELTTNHLSLDSNWKPQDFSIGSDESGSDDLAEGGNSNNDSEGFDEFEGGGTHEQNSLGGIPLGLGSNGKRNKVEAGETRYNFKEGGYIFSNRINTNGLFKDAEEARNEFALGGDPIKRTNPKEFTNEYINSPNYKKKLQKSGYDNVDETIKERSKSVSKSKLVEQNGSPNFMSEILNKITSTPYSKDGSAYIKGSNSIVIDQATDKLNKINLSKNSVTAHEFGHAELAGSGLNDKDNAELLSRQKAYNTKGDKTSALDLDKIKKRGYDKISHDLRPDENKADLNAFRFNLNEEGIYDARKEEFSKEHLKKAKGTFIKNRLLKNYSEKDLIWLMNNVASTKNETNNITA